MRLEDKRTLWLRWVAANAFGELFGLGATLGIGALLIPRLDAIPGLAAVLASFAIAVASGGIEATLVGLVQWWAMHPWFPGIARRAWWLATLAGALVAYVLGYLPSTLMGLGEASAGSAAAPAAEPPQAVILLLAGGLGIVGGAVLSFAQWLVLRREVERAGWWLPANMLAWLAGMPVIFWGIDAAQKGPLPAALILAGALFLAGIVVSAVHGIWLVWLAGQPRKG